MLDVLLTMMLLPNEFGLRFENHAWGHQYEACVIGRDRWVRMYGGNLDTSVVVGGRVSEAEYERAGELLEKARSASYRFVQVAADAGSLVWYARVEDQEIKIRELGDYTGWRTSPTAHELANKIEGWCGYRPGPDFGRF